MITELRIQNFAIISESHITFDDGLTVLTGETGAGKSIIIDALSLLLGKQAGDDYIKTGEEVATLEVTFKLPNPPEALKPYMENDDVLILYRKLTRHKGSINRINNQTVTLKTLRDSTSTLVDILGQHEHIALFEPEHQLTLLDQFGYQDTFPLLEEYYPIYTQYQELARQKNDLSTQAQDLESRLEFLNFQIQDIENCGFKPNEEEELTTLKQSVKEREKYLGALSDTAQALEQAHSLALQSKKSLDSLISFGQEFETESNRSEKLLEHFDLLNDFIHQKNGEAQQLEQVQLDDIEARLDLMFRFKNKYKTQSINDLLERLAEMQKEAKQLHGLIHNDQNIEDAYNAVKKKCLNHAHKLHEVREKVANQLEHQLEAKMKALHFSYVDVSIQLHISENEINAKGITQISLCVSTNAGENPKPLSKIASGGEISRILLSLKTLLFNLKGHETIVLDEADSGIGGITALKLGEFIHEIARSSQVICITHLPQIAQYADHHYLITKNAEIKSTVTQVTLLSSNERKNELARMVGGEAIINQLSNRKT